ncbi:MAG: DUF1080 domain-containing protein [Thermoguttaceae bacterium]|nr:DUF1080 domain-containing protein [Thermoguttaceae bacterium]
MKLARILGLVAGLVFSIEGAGQQLSLEGPPPLEPDTSGWKDLFAPDLSDAIYPAGVWRWENGVLTADEDQAIWTKRTYKNFILSIEFKNAEASNSGVIVYCNDLKNWIPNSIEIQICDDFSEKWSKMPPTWHCGAIFGRLAPKKSMVRKPGEWNRMVIKCVGPMIYVVLNGELVTEMDMRKWTSAKVNPDGSSIPPWLSRPAAELPQEGHIGLQGKHYTAPIYFRNLKILELSEK